MTCSAVSKPPSRPSVTSWPTPLTNCAPRSPAFRPSSKSPSLTPTPTPTPSGRSARKPSQHQERLVTALLTLATSERGVEAWEPFDLAQITQTVLTGRRHEADRQRVNVETSLPAAPSYGDPKLVELLVANLIDNALHYNITGGRIEISTISAPGRATITVSNTGPTIPPSEIDRLFQPFQRTGNPRIGHTNGHGLGLAIVAAIAQAHHAKITAHPRPQGGLDIAVAFESSYGPA